MYCSGEVGLVSELLSVHVGLAKEPSCSGGIDLVKELV